MVSFTHPMPPCVARPRDDAPGNGRGGQGAGSANKINLWLGQDGFDYPFQIDYRAANDWLIHGLRDVSRRRAGRPHLPGIQAERAA